MTRARFRELGYTVGRLPPGPLNALTDVAGVRVGHVTIVHDTPSVARTGVTAIHPLAEDYVNAVVFGGFHAFNGFGEMTGIHWLHESGLLSSPVCLGSAFSVGVLRDALLADSFERGFESRFHQPTVAETNDGLLSDGLAAPVTRDHLRQALATARSGPLTEGNVGGGTGTVCHEFKGGIGTSSRQVRTSIGDYVVGVLVQANYGRRDDLIVDGVPVGAEIGYEAVPGAPDQPGLDAGDGSIVIVVATDAPLLPVQCARLAKRAPLGLGRVGGYGSNTSGDLILAFATGNRIAARSRRRQTDIAMLPNDEMTHLFPAVAEATEEAILNALATAETMTGRDGHTVYAIPVDLLKEVMVRHGRGPAL